MNDHEQWPTFSQELARKALAKLDQAIERHDAKVITERELFLIADALYDASSGLIDKKELDVIGAVYQDIRVRSQAAKRARLALAA